MSVTNSSVGRHTHAVGRHTMWDQCRSRKTRGDKSAEVGPCELQATRYPYRGEEHEKSSINRVSDISQS
jgi:hypothetical protein